MAKIKKLIGTKIDILGYEYNIKPLSVEETERTYGICHTYGHLIEIDPSLRGLTADDTIMHELVHAIDHTLSLGLSEATVHRLGYALGLLLRNNQNLVEYFKD